MCVCSLLSPHCDHSPNRGNTPVPRTRHASEMSNPEIARYLEKEHLRDAEENDYHLMEGLIKQHKPKTSNTIDIPINAHNDHVSNILYDVDMLTILTFYMNLDDPSTNMYRYRSN